MCCCFLKEVISAAHERAGLRPSAAQHRPHHVPTKQLSTVPIYAAGSSHHHQPHVFYSRTE